MTKKQQTTIQALTDMLSDNLGIDFARPLPNADQFRSSTLDAMIEHNLGQIQNHLEEVGHFVKMKLACIDELNQVNAELEARAITLKKMGERPPVPAETRSPKSSKAG